jgi:hypothetical protein
LFVLGGGAVSLPVAEEAVGGVFVKDLAVLLAVGLVLDPVQQREHVLVVDLEVITRDNFILQA